MNYSDQIKEDDGSKKQKTSHECKLCYVEQCSTTLKCGHEMCAECCIKHFRKTINCPFCRAVICEKEDRKRDYKKLIADELHCIYTHGNYENKEMSMRGLLRFKGLNNDDTEEIIDAIKDRCRCLEILTNSEKYTEYQPSDSDNNSDNDSEWESCENESEFKSEEK